MADVKACAIYVRISEDEAGDRLAVTRHEADCRALADRLGLAVGRVYVDNDLSATSGVRRPDFEQLLEDQPAVVLCWHTDRLIRTMGDLERVIGAGYPLVHAVQAGGIDLSTPSGRMNARILTSVAQHEGEHRRARQESAARQARAAGKWSGGRRPFGYEVGMGALVPAEAQAVRDGFGWFLGGVAPAEIARRWNARGLVTTQAGVPWRSEWITPILANPTYAGLRTHLGKVVGDAAWEPLVERGAWEAAQGLLAAPGRRQNKQPIRSSLLASLALCGACDGVMHGGGNVARGGLYVCASGRDVAVKREAVDEHVRRVVAELLAWWGDVRTGRFSFDPGPHSSVIASALAPPLARGVAAVAGPAVAELAGLESQLDALADDLALSPRVLARRTAAIEARLAELRAGIAAQAVAQEPRALEQLLPLGDAEDYGQAFLAAGTGAQRAVLAAWFRVVVHAPGRGSRAFRPETVEVEMPGAPF
jgi:DNA invertase Pin-like site-specific DNA recombinase